MKIADASSKKLSFIIYSNLQSGGIPSKIIDIANHFDDTHVLRILLQKKGTHDRRSLITKRNIQIIDSPFRHPLLFIFWVWWQLVNERPSSVLAFISSYALPVLLIKTALLHSMKVIVNEDHYTQTMISSMKIPFLHRFGISYLYPKADHVIVPTQIIKKQLLQLAAIPESRISSIPNWTCFAICRSDTRKPIDFVFAGRLVREKNPIDVVRCIYAYTQLYGKNIRCEIVGEGSERPRILKYIRDHNLNKTIKLRSATDSIVLVLRDSKVLLFFSDKKTEGFPVIFFEAMASRTIVISKSFEGITEVIQNMKNGFIAKDNAQMLTYMRYVVQQYRFLHPMVHAAVLTVKKNHSYKNISRYISLLTS